MKRLVYLAVLVMGCGLQKADVEDYRAASPSRQGINIQVPAKGGQALESDDVGQIQQAVIGETAALYQSTRAVTLTVNYSTAWVLALCEAIVSYPATTVDDTQAVWGPWTDSLSPNTYRFTVTKAGAEYDYKLEGKAKDAADSAFIQLIYGHHKPGKADKQGSGNFTADWDAAATLPEAGDMIGKGEYTYSRDEKLDVTVGVKFRQVKDDANPGTKVDADYAFAKADGGDGSFDFVVTKDMTDLPNNTAALERLSIRSRWHDDGAGRADVKASGGDIVGGYQVSECWGSGFLETYYSAGVTGQAPGQVLGVATDCVFAAAEYSTL
ncbi:MAG TPA: hypothetical protein VGK67_38600 [Myxococcales bacterium]|jgi:hypothetical protein